MCQELFVGAGRALRVVGANVAHELEEGVRRAVYLWMPDENVRVAVRVKPFVSRLGERLLGQLKLPAVAVGA